MITGRQRRLGGMDFAVPAELDALRDEATALAFEWAQRSPFPEDSWIVGHDAAFAHWCYLIARTDPDAPKHAGLSEFVVDMHSNGVNVSPIEDITTNRHFCEVAFDSVRVPADHLVGDENNSFRQLMRQMEHE